MLKKLHIKNFQGHRDSILQFGPGINSIVGRNDFGKTSILRSIDLANKNRPLGKGYIRKNQPDNTIVEIETDAHTVSRERGELINEYRILGIKEPFTSFGNNPPEDVVNILNLNEVNIQSQLESPFLILSSPGQIAQHIRSISGLDVIDKLTSYFKNKIIFNSNLLKNSKKELEEVNKKLSILKKIDIEKFEELLQKAEKLIEENCEIGTHISSLDRIIRNLFDVEKTWVNLPENLDPIFKEVKTAVENLQNSEKQVVDLNKILGNLVSVNVSLIKLPEKTDILISKIDPMKEQYNNITGKINSLISIFSELDNVGIKKEEYENKIKNEQNELFNLLDQITVCPICTSKLTDKTKEKLLENY